MFKVLQEVFEDICARLHKIETALGIGVQPVFADVVPPTEAPVIADVVPPTEAPVAEAPVEVTPVA